jgi:two-component system alkaline phosphatase synthesis response regulator PhoP
MPETKKKILIVDDEPDILEVMEAILANAGFEILKAGNGRDALILARDEQPDLILLDIKMPEMDGEAITEILRNSPLTRNIRIAYLSNLVHERQVRDGHVTGSKIGDLYFIPKTYSADRIIELVNRNLESDWPLKNV